MIVIAVALVLIAAACTAVLVDATRSMLPGVTPVALQVQATVPTQRTREVAPDAIDDAHRVYSFVAALPTEPRSTLRATL
jgi:hypothetical protein